MCQAWSHMPVIPVSGKVKAQDHEFKVIFCQGDNLANWDTVSKWKPRQKLKTKINLAIFPADGDLYQLEYIGHILIAF